MDKRTRLSVKSFERAPERELPGALVPRFTGIRNVRVKGDYIYPRHQHADYQIILVTAGKYVCTVNDVDMTLARNTGLVVKPGDWHSDFCTRPLQYFALQFTFRTDPNSVDRCPFFADDVAPTDQCFEAPRRIWRIAHQLQSEARTADPVSPHIQDALCLELFWRVARALPPGAISDAFLSASLDRALPDRLQRLFRDHLDGALSVDEMAKALGMSRSSLAHKTKAVLGVPPARAFLEFKMNRARHHLEHTEMPMKEIAFRLGFRDPYHFSRAFKRVFGKSPSSFR